MNEVLPPEELRDKDGWHWLRWQAQPSSPFEWNAASQTWRVDGEQLTPPQMEGEDFYYDGPCHTPADLREAEARGYERGQRDAIARMREQDPKDGSHNHFSCLAVRAETALPIKPMEPSDEQL